MPPCAEKNLYNKLDDNINDLSQRKVYEELRPKNESLFMVKIREVEKNRGFVTPIKWTMVIFMLLSHITLLSWYGYYWSKGLHIKWQTNLFVFGYGYLGGFGVTAGVHRYWSHRSFKASPLFQWMLGIMFSIANAYKLYDWIRDHRVHHKFTETSADPHDARRGFFFSHIGWLMMMKHPDVIREGRKIDMSDILRDPVVQFNSKYHLHLKLIFCIVIPISIPPLLWGETWGAAALAQMFAMHCSWHVIWSVNSLAHLPGTRPYNPNINPSQCVLISFLTIGEGWHNYHHTFPWDYRGAELPFLNVTTLVLDAFARIGLVSHRKTTSKKFIQATIKRNFLEKVNLKSSVF